MLKRNQTITIMFNYINYYEYNNRQSVTTVYLHSMRYAETSNE